MFQDSSENEVIRLELVLAKEQEARRALTLSMEETGGRLGHDYQAGGSGRVGFDNSLDISQIEREAAEGQEVDPKTQNYFEHCPFTSLHSFPLSMDNCFSSRSSRSHQVCPGLRQLLPLFLLSSSLHKLTLLQVSPFPLLQVKYFQSKIIVYFSRYSTLVEMQQFPLSQPVVP